MASLGILTAGVAHEINNPLNFIMGSYIGLELYFEDKNIDDEEVEPLLESLRAGLDKASAIVQSLNQFSRQNEKYDEECDINSIIENCLTMLNYQVKYGVTISKIFNNNVNIKGNTGKLHQAFMNILLNAFQAINSKGEIIIKTYSDQDTATIEITDNGEGISEEIIPKITDPFYTTKEPGEGTGLGLSITYNIIKTHKGKLEFNSEEGKGTTVRVILPVG